MYLTRSIAILFFLICFQCWGSDVEEIKMFRWTRELGLPSNNVRSFAQDQKGFIWIATDKGLVRFDGHNFLPVPLGERGYGTELKKLFSIEGKIYVLTYDDDVYIIDENKIDSDIVMIDTLKDDVLKTVLLEVENTKQVVYNGNSLKLCEDGTLSKNKIMVPGTFNAFFKDANNKFWIASADYGIGYLKADNTQIDYIIPNSKVLSSLEAKIMVGDKKGERIWFTLDNGGLGFLEKKTESLFSIANIKENPYFSESYEMFSILYDLELTTLFFDKTGNLWIGTASNGMFRISFKKQPFQFYQFDYRANEGLGYEDISSPIPISNGDIWIGNWGGGGVNILKNKDLNLPSPPFESIKANNGVKGALQDGFIYPIFEDSKGNVWIGTFTSGLHYLNKKNKIAQNYYFHNYTSSNSALPSNIIMDIFEDKANVIWICMDGGLARLLPGKKRFESSFQELENPEIFKDKHLLSIFEDSMNNLWITTESNGVYRWNRKNNKLTHIESFGNYSANNIYSIIEEPENSLWLAGLNGLFSYDLETDSYDAKINAGKSPINHIESMILGKNKRLWLGTVTGLFVYDFRLDKIENLDLPVGLKRRSFTRGVSKDSAGYMYFGSRNGFYRIHSDILEFNESDSIPLMFTDLKIKGISYRDIDHSEKYVPNNMDISSISEIVLSHANNTFSLEYLLLDYAPDEIKSYETSMVNEDEENIWTSTFDTSKSFQDLDVGTYFLKVRKESTSSAMVMKITILPPWWRTIWAYLMYIILTFIIIAGSSNLYAKKKLKKELKFQQDNYDKLRFRFFLNVSHEIRTPLTLIKGGIERLHYKKAVQTEYEPEFHRIQRNIERLTSLVNEVLDLKKIERSDLDVNLQLVDLKRFLENAVDVFRYRENEKKIILRVPEKPIWIKTDKSMLESIIYNLLSNAIKYSLSDAKVVVCLFKPKKDRISISVKNKGVGIERGEQQLIFERFYQSEEHLKTGTGIGLALVKQYVGLLNGKIDLQSEMDEGSTFTITFPYEKFSKISLPQDDKKNNSSDSKNSHGKYSIVIIDDQEEIRQFVKEILEETYNVYEASNGKEGLKLIDKVHPELIISDIMMPKMNGFELCKKIRGDILISHIPIILLTAKTGNEAQIESLRSGADSFINKPFNQEFLKLKVDSLIENRKALILKYGLSLDENLTVLALNNQDKLFLEKFENILTKIYYNSNLSVEELASEMAISVSGFYRKIKSLTGSSPVEFVRIYRLKKAAYLLKTSNLSVTEISENTGFGSQKYFSNAFKRYFEKTPLHYRKSVQSEIES